MIFFKKYIIFFNVFEGTEILFQEQGDQIRRTFAQWTIVYFRLFYKDYRCGPKVCATFFPNLDYICINFDKNRLGYVLGDFFHKLIWSLCSRACTLRGSSARH
jgi:hypothetical protein